MSQQTPVYLDYAAATPVSDRVLRAMQPYYQSVFYNPSALYDGAREAKAALAAAREQAARAIGARPSEIVFTAGGSESINLAIKGVMSRFPGKRVLISAVEHDAVKMPAAEYSHDTVVVDAHGRLSPEGVRRCIKSDTVLVSIIYASNEIGTVQPIREIAQVVEDARKARQKAGDQTPLYLHTDASQAPLYLECHVARLGVDLMTINAGKIYGPKQSGLLYVKSGIELTPLIHGGGQEYGVRSGTESLAQAVGCATALEAAVNSRKHAQESMAALRAYFVQELEALGGEVNGHKEYVAPHIVHVTFPNYDNERVLFALNDRGVYASAGSACSASKEDASPVLAALGASEDYARASIRFSLGQETTKEQLTYVCSILPACLAA